MKKTISSTTILLVSLVISSPIFAEGQGTTSQGEKDSFRKAAEQEGKSRKVRFEHPHYLHKTSFFKLNKQSDYDVVFIGDSITERSDWYDIFPNLKVANRGINGDVTVGVLNRMDTIINTNADKAFLMIGVNDIAREIDINTIFNNYVQIINNLKSNSIKVFVQSTLLTHNRSVNKDVNELNMKLIKFCKENDIVFIDLNPLLSKYGELNKDYSSDGVHLNGKAYSIWSKAILKYIH